MVITSTEAGRDRIRIEVRFPVKLRSIDVHGKPFEIDAILDNLCTGGLYIRLPRLLALDAKVFAVIRLSPSMGPQALGARVAIRGTVLRSEPLSDGTYGIAVAFKRYRFV